VERELGLRDLSERSAGSASKVGRRFVLLEKLSYALYSLPTCASRPRLSLSI